MMSRTLVIVILLFSFVSTLVAQDLPSSPPTQLSVPLLEGSPAPFSGLLVTEENALQCITDAASVERLTVELAARNRELEVSTSLREEFITEQRQRIVELSSRSWWDEHGTVFMFSVGIVLGVFVTALIAGLAD